MVVPEAESLMVTAWVPTKPPDRGLKVGVAAMPPTAYAADATGLLLMPMEVAMACSVSLAETAIGEPYVDEPVVGVVPLVV
jgi:hypothetical protein